MADIIRTWRVAYEIDIDAVTAEDAARQAAKYARDTTLPSSWTVISTESHMGEPMSEISGLVHINSDDSVVPEWLNGVEQEEEQEHDDSNT